MIEINHLVKKYGTNFAVDDISFSVKEGEVLGFLGRKDNYDEYTYRIPVSNVRKCEDCGNRYSRKPDGSEKTYRFFAGTSAALP